tara:strand:- start:26835 stop:28058 length:1224 start_codon:yes stop_codon:yes gene_type:complete
MNCRHCKKKINRSFLDLGNQPLANSLISPAVRAFKEPKFPLKVFYCDKCFLVQIEKVVHQKKIFNKTYPYFSSYSSSWLKHVENYSNKMIKAENLNKNSFVIEIASNDGYLLQNFKNKKIPCLGIEPTKNTALIAKSKGIETISKFFSSKLAIKVIQKYRHPNLIICKNVLAHVPNLNDFILGLKKLTNKNTIITIEFPHLLKLIKNFQYDTIYHEHFCYFSLISLEGIFKKFNLKIFDVEEVETHGGSLRIFACDNQALKKRTKNVDQIIMNEKNYGITDKKLYSNFAKNVMQNKKSILNFFADCHKKSKTVVAYGAAAKGNTMLNYCKITSKHVKQIFDLSPHKQNMLMPGSKIKISNPKDIKLFRPDFILILPWNLKKELSSQLRNYKKQGAKFVTFIPKLNIF